MDNFYKHFDELLNLRGSNRFLTENQLIGILQFAQGGVKALENFRMQSEGNTDTKSEQEI